jgi:hypothetical protein
LLQSLAKYGSAEAAHPEAAFFVRQHLVSVFHPSCGTQTMHWADPIRA